jgi:ATPase subunit of ABC transporter with duplicated ATPase domains
MEQESREDEARQRTLQRESEWISSSPKARQAKSKARYQRYEDLLKIANAKQNTVAQITIPVAERLGQNVVDFDHLTKGFGDNLLIDDLTFKLPPGGIVGVIGPNGAGKTTLFRMITGQEQPDSGTIKIGESVHLGYVDQSRDSLDGKKTVWEEISEGNDMILVQLQGRRPAEEGRHAFGRRAQPRASGKNAAFRCEFAAARRTDQRPRRRHPACAGRSTRGFRRLCGDYQPRSLVS